MIAKLYNTLALAAIATVLAAGGFSAFLFGSGRLNAGRIDSIAAVLRGEYDESDEDAELEPAEEEDAAPTESRARSADEVRAARQRDQLRHHVLERAKCDVEARQRLLDQSLQHVLDEQQRLATERSEWTDQQDRMTGRVQQDGAKRELELVAGLPPKQAKEHIVRLWNKNHKDAVALVMQLEVSTTKRIFASMKSAEEQKIMSELLEQLRGQESVGAANESGTTTGAAAP